jgi:hypothetical protein
MRDIRASVEVRALIGADSLRELRGTAFAHYECWQCGRQGRTAEPTSVIVLAYRVFRVVELAHAACAGSHIIELDAAAMTTLAGLATAPQHGRRGRWAGRQPCRDEDHPAKRRSA